MSPGVMLMLVGDEACREGEKEREGGTGTVKSGRKHTRAQTRHDEVAEPQASGDRLHARAHAHEQ